MNVIPKGKVDKVQFCESHVAPWGAHAADIGTTAGAVSDLAAKTAAARAAFNAQRAAQQAAMAATNEFHRAVAAMATAASDIIKQVRAKAATGGGAVYGLAEIPAPATPAPVGPLGKPTRFKVELTATGAVELSWKCAHPRGATGAIYQVWRRVGEGGEFVHVGGTGTKSFVDATLPAGSAAVTYQVQAVRSTGAGPCARFVVNFGVTGAGGTAASVAPAKLAA